MEDIEESRQILDRHNWDLEAAINSHMGFDMGSQQQSHSHQMDSNHASSSSHHNPSTSRDANLSSTSTSQSSSSRTVARGNSRGPVAGGGSFFGWVWQLFTRPVEFFFRYFWEFIGVGLRFLRTDPRMGKCQFLTLFR